MAKEGLNQVTLLGNLGKDAELRQVGDSHVCNMRIATTESWFDKQANERKEHTEWHSCDMWGKRAESLASHLSKGTTVLITGRIRTREVEKDGDKKWYTSIKVDNLIFAGGGRNEQRDDGPSGPPPSSHGDDDLPF